jgi:LmeA-like phospholipid-binding
VSDGLAVVVLAVVAVLAVLAVGVALSDRFVARLAERKATEYVSAPLGQAARVRVHGSPFLSQAIRGRYGDVEVTSSGLQVGVLAGTTLHAHLVNARLPLRDLLSRRASELPVEHVHGHLVIPYTELARISLLPGLRLQFRDDRLIATAALPVPGLGQLARVSGEAVATIADNGGVWLRVRNVAVAGVSVPSIVLNQLVPSLAFPIPLPQLPYGLRLERLTPTPDGLQVSGSAQAVVFRGSPYPAPDPAR